MFSVLSFFLVIFFKIKTVETVKNQAVEKSESESESGFLRMKTGRNSF